MTHLEDFIKYYTTLFIITGPIDLSIIFFILTKNYSQHDRNSVAFKSSAYAFIILLIFTFFGNSILNSIGISLNALKITAGILLCILAYKLIFSSNGLTSFGENKDNENKQNKDIAIFPLAVPLIVGAGAISSVIVFQADAKNSFPKEIILIFSIFSVMLTCYICFYASKYLYKVLRPSIQIAIERLTGMLLFALGVEFTIQGIEATNLLN